MNKKVIIWTSVAVIAVGGIVGGVLWWQNRDKPSEDGENGEGGWDDDVRLGDSSGGGFGSGSTSGGYTGGSSGGSTSTGGSGTVTPTTLSNFDKVKKFFGKSAKLYDNRLVVGKSADDFDKSYRFTLGFLSPKIITVGQNWGLGGKKIYATFYKSGNFFIKIEGMDTWIIAGKYTDGGDEMRVTDAKGKWQKNIGRVADLSNPAANVKLLLTSLS